MFARRIHLAKAQKKSQQYQQLALQQPKAGASPPSSPGSSTFSKEASGAARAPVALGWAQSFAGPRLSNSLRFWPQLGLHGFRKISPATFT